MPDHGTAIDARGMHSTALTDKDARKQQALNALWNAAGAYDIEPDPWQLFAETTTWDGIPLEATSASDLRKTASRGSARDALLYRNTASGLLWKWYDGPAIQRFAAAWEEDFRALRLDELCWLVFSEAAFERERAIRPALDGLHAAFLESLPSGGRGIVEQLDVAGGTQDGLENTVLALAYKLYRFDGRCVKTPDTTLHLGVSLLGLSMRADLDRPGREKLRIRTSLESVSIPRTQRMQTALSHFLDERAARKAESNRAYVERCFGPLLCSPAELEELERATCTDVHANCHLWLADGSRPPGDLSGREFRTMMANAEEQLAKNRDFYNERRRAFETAIEKLAQNLNDRLHSTTRFSEKGHRFGTLDARSAWRADALDDNRVFQKKVPIDAPDVRIDVLLDASGSRSEQQEAIAAQAYVLGQALSRCHIPVRICAFSSLRDYTVLRVFCGYGEVDGIGNVMRYFAAGMNRDGLALRALERLVRKEGGFSGKHLLLVLTDGSPMDDHAMPDSAAPASNREYVGKPAVRDTASQVRALRRQGIQVAALHQGPDDYFEHARLIYGTQAVRIKRIERMAAAAALLIASSLEEA